jgi:hypothetical protein
MIKFTKFSLRDESGIHIEFNNSNELIKTAGYAPELQTRLQNLEKVAGHSYVLVNAMGSGEYWGSNRNGDYFPETSLQQYYHTFEKMAHAFKHHVNKDPELAFGTVKIAVFNPVMHRVELVLDLANDRAEEILKRIEAGEYPAVSMGCKVPYDVCSICGHQSKATKDYCDHLKYQMNMVLADGRKVYAINNHDLKFFDISFVRIPAERTAGFISKIASAESVVPSAIEAEEYLKAANIKESTINKLLDGNVEQVNDDPKMLIRDSQRPLPWEQLEDILSGYTASKVMSTLLGLRIMPRPEEFQRMILIKAGKKPLADAAAENGILLMDLEEEPAELGNVSLDNFDDEIANKLAAYCPGISLTAPHILRRVLVKRAGLFSSPPLEQPVVQQTLPQQSKVTLHDPMIPLMGMGAMYMGYAKLMNELGLAGNLAAQSKFEKFLLQKPWLIPLLLGSVAIGTVEAQKYMQKESAILEPRYLERAMIAVPASYLAAGYQENKVRQGQPISDFGNLIRKHPFLMGAAGTWGLGKLYKLVRDGAILKKAEYDPDIIDRIFFGLSDSKFEQFYKDIVEDVN